tara:strand:- start:124412 stop:124774 length:363 start_codon:yes stop_codon:yes gene_type:complete
MTMKKIYALLLLLALPLSAHSDAAVFIGINYTFGGNLGLSIKALSDDDENNGVAAVGVSYYPMAENKLGIDAGVGYAFDSYAVTAGWDFLQKEPVVSVGYADTDDDSNRPAPAPVFVPAE